MAGLHDLKGVFQPRFLCDSVLPLSKSFWSIVACFQMKNNFSVKNLQAMRIHYKEGINRFVISGVYNCFD